MIELTCQYELDSLCGFLKITRSYYSDTKDSSFINTNWLDAIDAILQLIEDQSQPSFDDEFNFFSAYNWTGLDGALSGPVTNGGNNAPKAYTGLVATHHRPSDDLSLLRKSSDIVSETELSDSILDTCECDAGSRVGSPCRNARRARYPPQHLKDITRTLQADQAGSLGPYDHV
jgi:hypothetical protein